MSSFGDFIALSDVCDVTTAKLIQREISDTTFNILRNKGIWVVAWEKDNIECSIFVDCQENVLYEILDSIYSWRILE